MNKALHDRISKVAYELYEKKGRRHGCQEEDWIEAESIVMSALSREEKMKKKTKPAVPAAKTIPAAKAAKGKKASSEAKKKVKTAPAGAATGRRGKIQPEVNL